ncbi:unnamed protein product [Lampetra fluviatilis]
MTSPRHRGAPTRHKGPPARHADRAGERRQRARRHRHMSRVHIVFVHVVFVHIVFVHVVLVHIVFVHGHTRTGARDVYTPGDQDLVPPRSWRLQQEFGVGGGVLHLEMSPGPGSVIGPPCARPVGPPRDGGAV